METIVDMLKALKEAREGIAESLTTYVNVVERAAAMNLDFPLDEVNRAKKIMPLIKLLRR